MPRTLRVEYEGARYHIMARGNRGTTVFGSDDDVWLWMKTLGEVVKRADWKVHAYVLMSTHYHLLLETPHGNLVEGMRSGRRAYQNIMEHQSIWAARRHKKFHDKEHFGGMDRGWVHGNREFRDQMKELLVDDVDKPVYASDQRRGLSDVLCSMRPRDRAIPPCTPMAGIC